MEFNIFTLKNGIRIIHKEIKNSEVSHCGLLINAGSRDESKDEQGLAHFIEHTIFKGTKKRKAFHILNRLDAVGGELNAYTSKEVTCVYASFLNIYHERAIELLADITFSSTFPEKEIAKEKDVIIDEINSYLDNPCEQIYDDFEEQIFAPHPIGRNILGTIESLKKINRKNLIDFISKHYATDRMVFSFVGNISAQSMKQLAEKHFSPIPGNISTFKRKLFSSYHPSQKSVKKSTYQAHRIIGNIAYSRKHKNRTGLILLNNLLGGPAMNSRLNLAIREKYGFTYNLESNYSAYTDTGIFNIYLGTDNQHLEKTDQLLKKELSKLKDVKLGTLQLHSAKMQLTGQIALAQESKAGFMLAIGKSLLLHDRVESLPEIYAKIEALTAENLLEIANEIFDEKQLSTLTFMGK